MKMIGWVAGWRLSVVVSDRGVATGVYIGIYTPKSAQVNFVWGKMTS